MNKYAEKYISIKKDKGLFRFRVVVPHGTKDLQRKEGGFATLGQAKIKARMRRDELLARRDKLSGGIITFADAKEQYLKHCGMTFKPSGFYSLKSCLDAHTSHWSTKLVTDLKASDVWDLGSKMMATLKPTTVDRNIRHIKGVFTHLVKLGILDRNPAFGVKYSKTKYMRKLTAMTKQEIDLLLDHTKRIGHSLYPVFFLAYQTGARAGELKALRVRDINFDDNSLVISRSYCAYAKLEVTPKSGKARLVPLNSDTMRFLRELTYGKLPDDYVLPRQRAFLKGEASEVLQKIQREIGIQQTNFHSIRASFITHLLLKGVPITSVQEIVGHSDLKTTQAYVRMVGSDLRGCTEAITVQPPTKAEAEGFCSALNAL